MDKIIFYNSGMEFDCIYHIRDQIKPVLAQRDIRFTEVKPDVPFLYYMLEKPVNSQKNGFHLGYRWCGGKCRWGTKLKTRSLDGLAYCYERGFFWEENGIRLYDILDRVSCWCCKNKNRKELKAIYQFLPQYWEKLKELQAQIPMPMKPYSRKGVPYGNVFDLERVFEQEIQAEKDCSALKGKRRRHEQDR